MKRNNNISENSNGEMLRTQEEIRLSAKDIDPRIVRDKILACLYAGGLGDALGYVIEFDSWQVIQKKYGKNGIREPQVTGDKAIVSDDTQMTLFTAEGYVMAFSRARAREYYDCAYGSLEGYLYLSYLCWYETQLKTAREESGMQIWRKASKLVDNPKMHHQRAPGNTCLLALRSGVMGTVENPINDRKGCGGVMRTAPLGFIRNQNTGDSLF